MLGGGPVPGEEVAVTEAEWMASGNIRSMLRFVQGKPVGFLALVGWRRQPTVQPGERRSRLFACACCRRIERLLVDKRLLQGVEAVEQHADGHGQREDLESVFAAVEQVYQETCEPYDPNRYSAAAAAIRTLVGWQPLQTDYGTLQPELMTVNLTREAVRRDENADRWAQSREHQVQCHLLRDIIGNPFHPVSLDPAWLTWRGGLLVSMAQRMYDSRDFSDMPVLADALEEAGCQDQDILGHCRSCGEHARGCWVVDLILGKT
jgi:hypothetical protein